MSANRAGFKLVIDGIDYAGQLVPRLNTLSLTEKLGGEADTLEVTLTNQADRDGRVLPTISRGHYATLSLGWEAGDGVAVGLVNKGRFMIDEVAKEGPPDILRIRARSADLTGDYRKRKDKAWKNVTLGTVLGDIARANGYQARIDPALASIALPSIEQAAKSDAAFVRDLGARYDSIATVKDGALIFLPIGAAVNVSGQTFGNRILTRRDNNRWTFTIPDREDHDGAEAKWHDRGAAKKKTVTVGAGGNPKRIKRNFASEVEARAAADAEARKAARGQFEFTYDMALGDPGIEPNERVTLQGWDSEIDAVRWLVDEASHTLDGAAGLISSIRLKSLV